MLETNHKAFFQFIKFKTKHNKVKVNIGQRIFLTWAVVMDAFNPRTLGDRGRLISESSRPAMVYRVSSRRAKATHTHTTNPVLGTEQTNKNILNSDSS